MKFSKISKYEFEKLMDEAAVGVLNPDESSKEISKHFKELELPAKELELPEWEDMEKVPESLPELFGYSNKDVNLLQNRLKNIVQENGRVKIWSVCDSTLLFLFNLITMLTVAGCTDITTESRPATGEEIPKDKPFCRWYYAAEGTLPEKKEEN